MARPIPFPISGRSSPEGPDLLTASLFDHHASIVCPRLLARTTDLVPEGFLGHVRSFVFSILVLFVVLCVLAPAMASSLLQRPSTLPFCSEAGTYRRLQRPSADVRPFAR